MNEYELRITITLLGEEQKRNVCNQHEKNIGSCCSTKKMLYTLSHQAVGFEVQLFFGLTFTVQPIKHQCGALSQPVQWM